VSKLDSHFCCNMGFIFLHLNPDDISSLLTPFLEHSASSCLLEWGLHRCWSRGTCSRPRSALQTLLFFRQGRRLCYSFIRNKIKLNINNCRINKNEIILNKDRMTLFLISFLLPSLSFQQSNFSSNPYPFNLFSKSLFLDFPRRLHESILCLKLSLQCLFLVLF